MIGRDDVSDLAEVFQALAAKLSEVNVDQLGDRTAFRRGETLFATTDGEQAELRLHPEIADAARRTPSTSVSERGPEWVRFSPPELDGHALDRAEAWFLSAWRAAGRKGGD